MHAAIYARFSTELQSVASIEDQARLCRERAAALGLTVGAWAGARVAQQATPATIQRLFAVFLVVMAAKMWISAR